MRMDKFVYLEKEEIPQLAEVQLNNKVLNLPFYGVIVRNNHDMQCLKNAVNSMNLKHTQVVMYGIQDADIFKNKVEKTLFEFTGEKINFVPLSKFITIIDPCAEYITSSVQSETEKLLRIKDLPESLKNIFNKSGKEKESEIKKLFSDESKITAVVEWYLKKPFSYNTEFSLPPCIPIKGKNTLNYAIRMNRIATTIQQDNGWQKTLFFAVDFKAFENDSLIETILNFIYAMKPKIIGFKIFNSDSFYKADSIIQRFNFNRLVTGLSNYRHEENAVPFFVNTDIMGYHLLGQGIGGFIEPISGNYNPDLRPRPKKVDLDEDENKRPFVRYGRWADPLTGEEKTFDVLKKISENTKQAFPCHCIECSKYDKLPTDSLIFNKERRIHRVHIRDTFVSELIESLSKDNLRVSLFDRFSENNHKLKSFKNNYS